MPGNAHETLIAVLHERPDLLDLLLRALGFPSSADKVEPRDSALRVANPLEVRPDLVLVSAGESGPWAIVEVQLKRDEDKRRRWPAAAAVLLDTRGVMGDVIIFTHDAAVAVWAASVAHVIGPRGTKLALTPLVVRLTRDEAEVLLATRRPELAVFAAWAVHDQTGRDARAVVEAATHVIVTAGDPLLRLSLFRAMLSMLGDALALVVREMVMNPQAIPDSPAYRSLVQEFEARGEARGEARALRAVLDARGIAVDEETQQRIVDCADTDVLNGWIVRAATARSLAEVFGTPGEAE